MIQIDGTFSAIKTLHDLNVSNYQGTSGKCQIHGQIRFTSRYSFENFIESIFVLTRSNHSIKFRTEANISRDNILH